MKKSKILIADDVQLNREMLSIMLGDTYDFVFASNGIEVIETLGNEDDIDLILLDINMPKMDGFEVLRIMNERHWIDDFPVIIISAEDSNEYLTTAYQLGVVDYLTRPFRTVIVQKRVENTLIMHSNQKRLIKLVEKQVYEKEKINNSMINIFSNVIELRNHESGSHTLNVQSITNMLLQQLVKITDKYNLNQSDIALISSLSALHDIGKIKVPESILNKPGKLTNDEWQVMKMHTIDGDLILQKVESDQEDKFIQTARSICRWHHEKYDGKGYPDGLVADDIPIAAQVVSMADVYDALTSERCYKSAFSHDVAINMILGGECGAFNPLLLKCLTEIANSLKELKDNQGNYDFSLQTSHIADEILVSNDLPLENAQRRMLENERRKKDFFMGLLEGIQFEYDRILHKVTFVNLNENDVNKRRIVFIARDNVDNILPNKYWNLVTLKLSKTTRDEPIVEVDVQLCIEGKLLPYHGIFMALWPEIGEEYISVLGHFEKKKV